MRTLLKLIGIILAFIGVLGVLTSVLKGIGDPGGYYCIFTLGIGMITYSKVKKEHRNL